MYEKEVVDEQNRLEKMKCEKKDVHDIRKQVGMECKVSTGLCHVLLAGANVQICIIGRMYHRLHQCFFAIALCSGFLNGMTGRKLPYFVCPASLLIQHIWCRRLVEPHESMTLALFNVLF
jgi:hypothetical protein